MRVWGVPVRLGGPWGVGLGAGEVGWAEGRPSVPPSVLILSGSVSPSQSLFRRRFPRLLASLNVSQKVPNLPGLFMTLLMKGLFSG